MASDEERRVFVVNQLKALCLKRFGDTDAWPALFDSYDTNSDGGLSRAEVKQLFKDADIGGLFVGAWVNGVFAKVDADGNDTLSRTELERVIASKPPPLTSPGFRVPPPLPTVPPPGFRVPPPLPTVPPKPAAKDVSGQVVTGVIVGVLTLLIVRRIG